MLYYLTNFNVLLYFVPETPFCWDQDHADIWIKGVPNLLKGFEQQILKV